MKNPQPVDLLVAALEDARVRWAEPLADVTAVHRDSPRGVRLDVVDRSAEVVRSLTAFVQAFAEEHGLRVPDLSVVVVPAREHARILRSIQARLRGVGPLLPAVS